MRIVLISLAMLLSAQAQAMNLLWLDRSPARYFTESDWQVLTTTMEQALQDSKDGKTVAWKNAETGHSGTIQTLSTLTINQQRCRETRFHNETPKASGRLDATLCLDPAGQWKIHTP